ncbi:hypothetical protein CQW44_07185 [Streptomyces griseofuscus]|uniref:Uncharacterized protein n=1 Tax=Streptomyces griseofuscus TaxID=146922 RepID=A0A426SAZ9_9ACTN|nr:hypothetical protein CQW44_07185 [Streptomyces griseofuscus]
MCGVGVTRRLSTTISSRSLRAGGRCGGIETGTGGGVLAAAFAMVFRTAGRSEVTYATRPRFS